MAVHASYTVSGMTCAHCVSVVTSEVGQLPGVEQVRVDLANGRLDIDSADPLALDAVSAAVAEAGYTLVGRT
jgi:copper chaperone